MKLLVAVALVLGLSSILGACATAPPERMRDPKPKRRGDVSTYVPPRERPELVVQAPALHIDVAIVEPDPTHELRWPLALSDHPELAPQYDVAKVLAEPGLDWLELCKIGAHRRTIPKLRDQLLYLRAWCFASVYDYPSAIETLMKLRSTVVPGLATAVRADLSNVLVSHDPNSARELVAKFGLASEMDVLDRLAATYVEVGKLGGAIEINELALANDPGTSPSKTCQRLTRRVLLDPETYRTSQSAFSKARPVPGFVDDPTPLLFGAKLGADPQCQELDAQLSCWLVKGNCAAWYKLRGVSELDAHLLAAHHAWPTGTYRAAPNAWWQVIYPALNARPKPEAYTFALLASEAALKLTSCDNTNGIDRVRDVLSTMVNDAKAPAEVVTRIKWLDENHAKLCFSPY